jgi:hypothetical protein
MPIRERNYPVRFTPRGLVDAFDATDKFPGACISLINLIFDQSNPEIMVSRPGVTVITNFPGFTTPGAVSVHMTIGSRTYGMIASGRNSGKDEPFSFNHTSGTFDTVTGITNANSPSTQATTGAWIPPTMANIGTKIVVTHPGFSGGAIKFGVFDISTPSAPTWTAQDTVTNALPSVPIAVANFYNRAYFALSNPQSLAYTDVLTLTRTSATQALTIGDADVITSLQGLPVQTTSTGIVQALLVFKPFQVWQITGDPATNNLAQNYLSLTVGTSAPRSTANSPKGCYFVSTGGPYIVDQLGLVRPVTHSGRDDDNPDIQVPFQNAVTPSRINGVYSGTVYRVSLETVIRGVDSVNDYWYDEHRKRWTGPHTFAYDNGTQLGNYFVLVSNANPAILFKSQIIPDSTSVYADNGVALMTTMTSSTFPKTGHMTEKQVVESTQELSAAGSAVAYTVTAVDDQNNQLNQTQMITASKGKNWGAFNWGDGTLWTSSLNIPHVYNVPWTAPLVFKKMALQITASTASALSVGTFFARYQDLGYTNKA